MRPMKTLVFDIETAPLRTHLWRPDQDYVQHEMLEDDSFMLTWAAKWLDRARVYSDSLDPGEAKNRNDTRIVGSLAEMLREAEVVIAHNAKRFDVPRVNQRLLVLRQEPLEPMTVVDTLILARKSFDLPYNKLDYLAEILLDDHKLRTEFDLWRRYVRGDEAAQRRMVRYNRKDVTLLENVFKVMRPYVKGLPRMAVPEIDREHGCPTCGSSNLTKRGFHDTNTSRYQTWECKDCGRYSRTYQGTVQARAGLIPLP